MKILRFVARVLLGLIIIVSILFTVLYGKIKITESHSLGQTENYKGILTMWQVDSFEGGTGSRKQFLLKVARSFEQVNQGVLVMVIEHTQESLKIGLEKGEKPDMISFGAGVKVDNLSQIDISSQNSGGKIGDKSYAVEWCRGGYTLIANPKLVSEIPNNLDSLLVSQSQYTQPLCALYLEGLTAQNVTVKSPMDAYVQFVAGKTPFFLGTQRDINRLERRNFEVITRPLTVFNDLYQYVALTSSSHIKQHYSLKFIEHLLSESVQSSLSEIGMLSSFVKVDYDNEHLTKLQDLSGFKTISAFEMAEKLNELQGNSLLIVQGQKELEIKIKNMLV